jgi:hypothetical protein
MCSPAKAAFRPPFLRTPMLRIGYGKIRELNSRQESRIALRFIRATRLSDFQKK